MPKTPRKHFAKKTTKQQIWNFCGFFKILLLLHVLTLELWHKMSAVIVTYKNYRHPWEEQNLLFLAKTISLVSANKEHAVTFPMQGGCRNLYPLISMYCRLSLLWWAILWQLRMGCPGWVIWGSADLTSSSALVLQVTVEHYCWKKYSDWKWVSCLQD